MTPRTKPTDPATRMIGLIGEALTIADREMAAIRKGKSTPASTGRAMRIAAQMGPLLGQMRRFDESQAQSAKTLTAAQVIAYLRKLPAGKREEIIAEAGGDDEDTGGSVLGG